MIRLNSTLPMTLAALALLALSACSGMLPPGIDAESLRKTQEALVEQAAQATATMQMMQIQIAQLETQVSGGTQSAVSAAATNAVLQGIISSEQTRAARPAPVLPTSTPLPPTPTEVPPTPTITNTPLPCNAAEFVEDVTIPNGTLLPTYTNFTKIWRVRNAGACTWTTAYDLVFVEGSRLEGQQVIDLSANVAPGQVIDLSVDMVSPGSEGGYIGHWKLRDSNGMLFDITNHEEGLSYEIEVKQPTTDYPYDFIVYHCLADWSSAAGRVPCEGQTNDSRGSVRRVDKPTLENGYNDDEPSLQTHPQLITDGYIRGKYPTIRIEPGYIFSSVIGCEYKSSGCDVYFQLDYQIGNGPIQTLATWHEVYDENFSLAEADLSSLAGKDVRLILSVHTNGSANQDRAQWLAPRILIR